MNDEMKYSWIGALIIIALTIVFALLPWIAFWSIGSTVWIRHPNIPL